MAKTVFFVPKSKRKENTKLSTSQIHINVQYLSMEIKKSNVLQSESCINYHCINYSQLITPKLPVTVKYLILHHLLTLHHAKNLFL